VNIGPKVIPPPEGADFSTMEGLKASMHLMKPVNFLVPFVAHAAGTLVGAALAALIAASHKMRFAMLIGGLFFIGGISAILMLGGPLWFAACDLALAYFPMAWLGGALGGARKPSAV